MTTETTKPTTRECIEWLWHDKEDPWSPESIIKAEAIRAQLLAAKEMAIGLERLYKKGALDIKELNALINFREAGGQ